MASVLDVSRSKDIRSVEYAGGEIKQDVGWSAIGAQARKFGCSVGSDRETGAEASECFAECAVCIQVGEDGEVNHTTTAVTPARKASVCGLR